VYGLYLVFLYWILFILQGVGKILKEVLQTLGFGSAYQVFDEKSKPLVIMPRVQASSSQSYGA
jgi:hypothetical protein